MKEKERIASVRERAHDEVRNKIEQTQDKIDAFDEERGSESELQTLKQLTKHFQDNFERVKKKLYDMQQQQKEKAQKEVSKQRRTIASKEKERNAPEERLNSTKPLYDRREQESELERPNEENKAVINDENASPSDKETAKPE